MRVVPRRVEGRRRQAHYIPSTARPRQCHRWTLRSAPPGVGRQAVSQPVDRFVLQSCSTAGSMPTRGGEESGCSEGQAHRRQAFQLWSPHPHEPPTPSPPGSYVRPQHTRILVVLAMMVVITLTKSGNTTMFHILSSYLATSGLIVLLPPSGHANWQ